MCTNIFFKNYLRFFVYTDRIPTRQSPVVTTYPEYMGRQLCLIRSRAGVAEFTLHDLRRSAITHWSREIPIQVVQQLAGHSDISTTRKYYLAVRSEDLDYANDVLNRILAKTREN